MPSCPLTRPAGRCGSCNGVVDKNQGGSADNILVFVIVFSELHIPAGNQRRVLGWGITGRRLAS
jgi:hypothetical protein